ncbi:hypothetical protein QTO34_010803 [Cnephaeus nilssonii]|uniref:Ribonuclease P protein subunit p29 n=1 Tax=Cnephaeus nilssonii TaxID=3371016 RepID=A0AA40HG59_CNENI|nr:hypothetical protein QTO34_010803 [Eptesicus nilssonii]
MRSGIYHALSQKEAKELDVQRPGAQRAEAFLQAFLRRCTPHMSPRAREDQLQRKAVVLDYFTRPRRKEQRRRPRGLSARQRRALRLFDIKPEQQRYDLFLPLHELWKQYIRDLCNGLRPDTQPQAIQAKLLKADLHGAIVSVTKSKCPSYVGVTGILLQETKHVFKIITKGDHLKAGLCVLCGNRRLRFLHSREQIPASVERAVRQEVQSEGNHGPVSAAAHGVTAERNAGPEPSSWEMAGTSGETTPVGCIIPETCVFLPPEKSGAGDTARPCWLMGAGALPPVLRLRAL